MISNAFKDTICHVFLNINCKHLEVYNKEFLYKFTQHTYSQGKFVIYFGIYYNSRFTQLTYKAKILTRNLGVIIFAQSQNVK